MCVEGEGIWRGGGGGAGGGGGEATRASPSVSHAIILTTLATSMGICDGAPSTAHSSCYYYYYYYFYKINRFSLVRLSLLTMTNPNQLCDV